MNQYNYNFGGHVVAAERKAIHPRNLTSEF